MSKMSISEFEANPSIAIARAEAGEVMAITRDGRQVLELRAKRKYTRDDPEWQAAYARIIEGFNRGIPGLSGPATYEERTGR